MQFTVTSIGHASHAIHYNGFSTLWRSAYLRDELKAKSDIATTGWKLEEDFGLLNMIIKPVYKNLIINDFTRQLLLPSHCKLFYPRPSLGLQILKKKFPYKSTSILFRDSLLKNSFLLIQLKVKCLRLNLKSNATISSNQIRNLVMQLSACTSWTSELSNIPLSLTCSPQYQINSEKNRS